MDTDQLAILDINGGFEIMAKENEDLLIYSDEENTPFSSLFDKILAPIKGDGEQYKRANAHLRKLFENRNPNSDSFSRDASHILKGITLFGDRMEISQEIRRGRDATPYRISCNLTYRNNTKDDSVSTFVVELADSAENSPRTSSRIFVIVFAYDNITIVLPENIEDCIGANIHIEKAP